MVKKMVLTLTNGVRQSPCDDSREGAAAYMVFNYDGAMEFFDCYREARDYADGLDDLEDPAVVFPLYAGVGIFEHE
jgi:hypothetical protein